jgi:hypothetical protein
MHIAMSIQHRQVIISAGRLVKVIIADSVTCFTGERKHFIIQRFFVKACRDRQGVGGIIIERLPNGCYNNWICLTHP